MSVERAYQNDHNAKTASEEDPRAVLVGSNLALRISDKTTKLLKLFIKKPTY